jgi:hypothetical protein
MRTTRVLLGWLVVMGATSAQAQIAQEQGTPTVPPVPAQPPPGAPPAAPVPEPVYPAPGETTTHVQGPSGETMPVVTMSVVPLAARRLVLDRDHAAAQVFVKINMSKSLEGEPTTITPDLYYGVTDYLTLGVVHTTPLGWQTAGVVPSAFCVTGKDHGCPKVYNNLGLDALGLILPGPLEIAGHLRFNFWGFDPFRIDLVAGFVSKLRMTWASIVLYPSFQIGLNKRNELGGPTPSGNKDVVYIPGEIIVQITPLLAVLGQAAIYGQVQTFKSNYRIPLGVAGLMTISPMLDVGLRWAWDNVGHTAPGVSRNDERSLVALANIHL